MRTHWKILAYIAQSMRDQGHPPTLQDIGTVLRSSSQAVISQALDRLEADGWIERDPEAPYGFRLTEQGRRAADERKEYRSRTHPQPPRAAVTATIKAIEDLISECDPEAIEATLDGLVTYIHARENVIRAERALFGEGYPDDE